MSCRIRGRATINSYLSALYREVCSSSSIDPNQYCKSVLGIDLYTSPHFDESNRFTVSVPISSVTGTPSPPQTCHFDGSAQFQQFMDGFDSSGRYFARGNVEICYNGTYSPVCEDGWDDLDAASFCNSQGFFGGKSQSRQWCMQATCIYQLGLFYDAGSEPRYGSLFGTAGDAILTNFSCNVGDLSLGECNYSIIRPPNTCTNRAAGVVCYRGKCIQSHVQVASHS